MPKHKGEPLSEIDCERLHHLEKELGYDKLYQLLLKELETLHIANLPPPKGASKKDLEETRQDRMEAKRGAKKLCQKIMGYLDSDKSSPERFYDRNLREATKAIDIVFGMQREARYMWAQNAVVQKSRDADFELEDRAFYDWLSELVRKDPSRVEAVDVLSLTGGSAKVLLRSLLAHDIRVRLLVQDPRVHDKKALNLGSAGLSLRTVEFLWNIHSELHLRQMGTGASLAVFVYRPGTYIGRRAVVVNPGKLGRDSHLVAFGQYDFVRSPIHGEHPAHDDECTPPSGSVGKMRIKCATDPEFSQVYKDRVKPLYNPDGSIACTEILYMHRDDGLPNFQWKDGFLPLLRRVHDQVKAWGS